MCLLSLVEVVVAVEKPLLGITQVAVVEVQAVT
jgi:hypothetical protein